MGILNDIFSNYILVVSFFSWFVAQVLKLIIETIVNKKFNIERIVGAGGMPSSHSALVVSMTISCAKVYGFSSGIFAISFLISLIVMYDAVGVRRATGENAKIINNIVDFICNNINPEQNMFQTQLKEFIGHTPIEVLGGIFIGIFVSLLIPVF